MTRTLPPLYPLTPDQARGAALEAWAGELLDAGCRLLQFRRKSGSDQDRLRDLERLLALARPYACKVIVDDRVDLCLLTEADGVHLGQEDLPPDEARQFLGISKIIGFSTHDLAQFEAASETCADYLALGPVFATASKERLSPVVPAEVQARVLAESRLPVVAIGGITPANARALWERGFASLAVIGALAQEPGRAWREFMARHTEVK